MLHINKFRPAKYISSLAFIFGNISSCRIHLFLMQFRFDYRQQKKKNCNHITQTEKCYNIASLGVRLIFYIQQKRVKRNTRILYSNIGNSTKIYDEFSTWRYSLAFCFESSMFLFSFVRMNTRNGTNTFSIKWMPRQADSFQIVWKLFGKRIVSNWLNCLLLLYVFSNHELDLEKFPLPSGSQMFRRHGSVQRVHPKCNSRMVSSRMFLHRK